ncbi:MAG TPA: phage portal protein [Gemmatimonadaceae bacterium]|nr:phage portal protein [Gemmatimonadaceae bacterium]
MNIASRIAAAFGFSALTAEVAAEQAELRTHLQHGDFEAMLPGDWRIGRAEAIQLPTVAKARAAVAPTIGRLPLVAYRKATRVVQQPALLDQPEASVPLSTTLTWTIDDLIFYPFAWWLITERDANRWPVRVRRVPRSEANWDEKTGALFDAFGKPVNPADVIRFDSWHGGLLREGRKTLRRAVAIEHAASLAEDNPIPSLELHNIGEDVRDPKEINKIIDAWINARRVRGVGFTNKAIETKAHGLVPEQLLIAGRQRADIAIVRAMNVPAWVVDATVAGQSMNYTNRQSRNAELIDGALSPYMSVIADRLSMNDVCPRGWRVKFDTDELIRPDLKTRFETYAIGVTNNFLPKERIATWEGWETTEDHA